MKFKGISKFGKIFAIIMVAIMAFTFLPSESFADEPISEETNYLVADNLSFYYVQRNGDVGVEMLLLETDGTLWYNSGIYAATYSELSDYDEVELKVVIKDMLNLPKTNKKRFQKKF